MTVFGASGFLGRHLVQAAPAGARLRAITRGSSPVGSDSHVSWVRDNLADAAALLPLIDPQGTVINLVFDANAGEAENRRFVAHLVDACKAKGVRRLVHCSTAAVAGRAEGPVVDECTPCRPVTAYERIKLALEEDIRTRAGNLPVAILRPTAIVGAGSRNLVLLSDRIRHGSALLNFFRRSLFRDRPMHLVPATNVAAALWHLAGLSMEEEFGLYIIAADDDPDNTFAAVERLLRRAFGLPPSAIPPLPIPRMVLEASLRLRHRHHDLYRRYEATKIRAAGFAARGSVAQAIAEFAEHVIRNES